MTSNKSDLAFKKAKGLIQLFETDEMFWSSLSPAEYLKRLRDAEESFLGFVKLIHPRWVIPQFHLEQIAALDKLEKGTLTNAVTGKPIYRVMFNEPPRHSKSTYATELFPAYYHLRNSTRSSMTGSYSGDLAQGFGKAVRDLIELPIVKQAFPNVAINPNDRSKDEWSLVDRNGVATGGRYFATGLSGTTTGRPANLLIWDDPIKTKEEADSPTRRNKAWDFITYSLQLRKQPNFIVVDGEQIREPSIEIAVMTRWNVDDPGGRVLETLDWKEGDWLHLNYPAIIDEGQPTERALWPDRFPLDDLKKIQRADPARFESLYQQRPFVRGGALMKTKWWKLTSDLPRKEDLVTLVAGCDTAFKAEENNDPTVMAFVGLGTDGNYYIYDIFEKRLEYPDLKRAFVTMNGVWKSKGLRGFYIEDRASGQSIVQDLRRMGGISVIPHKMLGDKSTKAKSVSPLIEGGLVYLPEGAPWLDDFMTEFEQFTGDAKKKERDNKVDAVVIALDVLSRIGTPMMIGEAGGIVQQGKSLLSSYTGKSGWKGIGEM